MSIAATGSGRLAQSGTVTTRNLTIKAWIRFDSVALGQAFLGVDAGGLNSVTLFVNNEGTPVVEIYSYGGDSTAGAYPMAGEWYFVCLRIDGSGNATLSFGFHNRTNYIHHMPRSAATVLNITAAMVLLDSLSIGSSQATAAICDVAVWTRALSDAEVEASTTPFATPIATGLWSWNKLQSTADLSDYSGNGHAYAITGTVTTSSDPSPTAYTIPTFSGGQQLQIQLVGDSETVGYNPTGTPSTVNIPNISDTLQRLRAWDTVQNLAVSGSTAYAIGNHVTDTAIPAKSGSMPCALVVNAGTNDILGSNGTGVEFGMVGLWAVIDRAVGTDYRIFVCNLQDLQALTSTVPQRAAQSAGMAAYSAAIAAVPNPVWHLVDLRAHSELLDATNSTYFFAYDQVHMTAAADVIIGGAINTALIAAGAGTGAAVGIESGPWANAQNTVTSITQSITTGGASYILVGVVADNTTHAGGNHVTSVTATGLTFTKLAGGTCTDTGVCAEYWGAPSSGAVASRVITANVSSASNFAIGILSLSGVASSPVGSTAGPGQVSTNLSVAFTGTTARSMLFADSFEVYPYADYGTTPTAASGTTLWENLNYVTQHLRSAVPLGAGGSQTLSTTGYTSGAQQQYCGVEILAAGSGISRTVNTTTTGTIIRGMTASKSRSIQTTSTVARLRTTAIKRGMFPTWVIASKRSVAIRKPIVATGSVVATRRRSFLKAISIVETAIVARSRSTAITRAFVRSLSVTRRMTINPQIRFVYTWTTGRTISETMRRSVIGVTATTARKLVAISILPTSSSSTTITEAKNAHSYSRTATISTGLVGSVLKSVHHPRGIVRTWTVGILKQELIRRSLSTNSSIDRRTSVGVRRAFLSTGQTIAVSGRGHLRSVSMTNVYSVAVNRLVGVRKLIGQSTAVGRGISIVKTRLVSISSQVRRGVQSQISKNYQSVGSLQIQEDSGRGITISTVLGSIVTFGIRIGILRRPIARSVTDVGSVIIAGDRIPIAVGVIVTAVEESWDISAQEDTVNINREPITVAKYPGQTKDMTVDFSRVALVLGELAFQSPTSVTWSHDPTDSGDIQIAAGQYSPRTSGLLATARFVGGTVDTRFFVEATFRTGQKSQQTILIRIKSS